MDYTASWATGPLRQRCWRCIAGRHGALVEAGGRSELSWVWIIGDQFGEFFEPTGVGCALDLFWWKGFGVEVSHGGLRRGVGGWIVGFGLGVAGIFGDSGWVCGFSVDHCGEIFEPTGERITR